MTARRRNHFVPRFLINRFASRWKGDTAWVWQHSRDADPIEISTRDAGVSRDFYGGSESPVEDGFAQIESQFGSLLASLDRGEEGALSSEDLRRLTWSTAVRTRALRLQMISTAQGMMDQLEMALSTPEAARYMTQEAKANFGSLVKGALKDRPFYQRWMI